MRDRIYAFGAAELVLAFVLAFETTSCGGSGAPADGEPKNEDPTVTAEGLLCEPFSACGGELLGHWRIVSSCWDPEMLKGPCPVLAYHSIEQSGTYEFHASGTYEHGPSSYALTFTASYDSSCSSAGPCEAHETEYQPGEKQSVETECVEEAGVCRCETSSSGWDESRIEPYFLQGSEVMLIVDEAAGTFSQWQYCVEGDRVAFYARGIGGFTLARD